MTERIDSRQRDYPEQLYDRPSDEDLQLAELNIIRELRSSYQKRAIEIAAEPVEDKWEVPQEAPLPAEEEPQAPAIPSPSFWGASPIVDLPVPPDYDTAPLDKDGFRLPSLRAIIGVGIVAAWAGTGAATTYEEQIDDPYSMVASLPVVGKDDPAKKELLDKLIANCADENVGDVLYKGNVSAESSIIWNVPNADGTLSPLSPSKLDPNNPEVISHPKAIVQNSILSIGACDTDDKPAVRIKDHKVRIDFSAVDSRITLEREKAFAEVMPKSRLDETVVEGAFSQETADALHAEMKDPINADQAVNDTLREVGAIITAPGSTYDSQVKAVSKSQLVAKILATLAVLSPGIAYETEVINDFNDTTPVGLLKTQTDKLSISGTMVNSAIIVVDPSTVNS